MYRKYISITVALCLMAMGGYAFAGPFPEKSTDPEIQAWHGFQSDWHNSGLLPGDGSNATHYSYPGPGDYNDYNDWNDPCCWDSEIKGAGRTGHRPPDSTVWACIEPKAAGPNVTGDVCCVRLSIMPWSYGGAPAGSWSMEFNQPGGDINCGLMIGLADKVNYDSVALNSYPVLNMHAGRVFTPGIPNVTNWNTTPPTIGTPAWWEGEGLWIGGGEWRFHGTGPCFGTINMYGGMIDVPKIRIWYGDVNLYGGLLYHNDTNTANFVISLKQTMNRIYVEGPSGIYPGGELRLKGNRSDQVWYYYDHGERICPCKSHGRLVVDYNGTDTSVTAVCTPGSAWNPTPINRAARVELTPPPILMWEPGRWVQKPGGSSGSHAVYFGLDFNDVNDATTGNPLDVYKGRQDPCSYDPGLLTFDTYYYWRIDEYNDAGDPCHPGSPWKGNTWWFKTKGFVSGDPVPADGTVGLSIPLQLSWSPGALTQPVNGHAVYFGTNFDDVSNSAVGNAAPLPGVSKYVQSPTIFPLSTLDYNLVADTDYYWRVDEINDTNFWKGEVWKFTNTNYFIIDNFDSYADTDAMLKAWTSDPCKSYQNQKISWEADVIRGGGGMRFHYNNGGWEGHAYGSYSEAKFEVNTLPAGGGDWTGGGALPDNDKARSLAISYIGGPYNDADPNYDRMYVAIQDDANKVGSIVLNRDTQAQRIGSSTQWDINLYDLNTPPNDVNLKSIKRLYIGFGVRGKTSGYYGEGTVIFDDIRLYQKRCVPAYTLTADLTGDCRTDINDVNVFADNWLAKQTMVTPKEPCNIDANLMLWYKFDDVCDTNALSVKDSSTKGKHGVVVNPPEDPTILWEPNGGFDGKGCINLKLGDLQAGDYNTLIVCPNTALNFAPDKNAITFSLWVNADVYIQTPPGSQWIRLITVFQDFNDKATDENEVVEIECPTPRPPMWSQGPITRFVLGPSGRENKPEVNEANALQMQMSNFGGGWNHYAFIADTNAHLMRIYHNGGLIAENNKVTASMFGKDPAHPVESFRIAKRCPGPYLHASENKTYTDTSWAGKIDDFRVYNYALSQAEVAWLGTVGHTGVVPFNNVANLKLSAPPDPNVVNFGDFAILAKDWLSQQWWP
jgi:hypothetical protein